MDQKWVDRVRQQREQQQGVTAEVQQHWRRVRLAELLAEAEAEKLEMEKIEFKDKVRLASMKAEQAEAERVKAEIEAKRVLRSRR